MPKWNIKSEFFNDKELLRLNLKVKHIHWENYKFPKKWHIFLRCNIYSPFHDNLENEKEF
jgi:hypothetical protein